jgi:TPR repeat protein
MARAVLTMLVCCGALCCAASQPLPQDAAPDLGPGEGHLVLVFDSLNEIRSLRLTTRMSVDTALAVDRIPLGVTAQTFRVPAGDYCIDSLRTGRVIYQRRDGDRALCFEVVAGTLTYPGHIAPRGTSERDAVVNVSVKAPEFLRRMRVEQPRLLDAHQDLRTGRGTRAAAWAEFAHGAFDAGEPALGARLLEQAVAEGDTTAKMELAFRAVLGDGVPEDKRRARLLYEEVAVGGNLLAARHACMANIDGWDGAPDPRRAQRYCTMGVERGDAVSAVLLVQLRRRGALPREPAHELELARFAADKGSAEGWHLLGLGLLESVPPDRAGARAAFEKAAAEGNGGASYQLGLLLQAERGAPRDAARILELFEVGASQNVPGAAIAAGRLLATGDDGLAADQARASAHFERAVRAGPDGLAALAWFLATCPDPDHRDGRRAQRFAIQLLTLREQRRPDDYAVLAAAYAENGDFDGALRNVERALDELTPRAAVDDPRLATWHSQRQSYQRQQPWREPLR